MLVRLLHSTASRLDWGLNKWASFKSLRIFFKTKYNRECGPSRVWMQPRLSSHAKTQRSSFWPYFISSRKAFLRQNHRCCDCVCTSCIISRIPNYLIKMRISSSMIHLAVWWIFHYVSVNRRPALQKKMVVSWIENWLVRAFVYAEKNSLTLCG